MAPALAKRWPYKKRAALYECHMGGGVMFTYSLARLAIIIVIGVVSCIGVAWNFWKSEREANRMHKLDMLEYERTAREREDASNG
jgi:hypothetical protein